jgi:hypothetical protein
MIMEKQEKKIELEDEGGGEEEEGRFHDLDH